MSPEKWVESNLLDCLSVPDSYSLLNVKGSSTPVCMIIAIRGEFSTNILAL